MEDALVVSTLIAALLLFLVWWAPSFPTFAAQRKGDIDNLAWWATVILPAVFVYLFVFSMLAAGFTTTSQSGEPEMPTGAEKWLLPTVPAAVGLATSGLIALVTLGKRRFIHNG
ncbi:MAG: hypothetical protein A2126_00125 [Candidatus Woykebacteria bacterium GWB1_45_5]|uniref:Uncharacterized protein n=2 Tax=Candidatus Woykeibacteriota TaxID=1817899 RepID=A0A1G1W345_9BACT|nr:MAG: hypothetical protein A2113_02710 [Candidatus Woykebacteria bacterium GWA1_44_8]OGY23278.1 MAG: hypothetical protein A2126_00125 [Candidatus Woykebacteria bacterium GWB1_45_5]